MFDTSAFIDLESKQKLLSLSSDLSTILLKLAFLDDKRINSDTFFHQATLFKNRIDYLSSVTK